MRPRHRLVARPGARAVSLASGILLAALVAAPTVSTAATASDEPVSPAEADSLRAVRLELERERQLLRQQQEQLQLQQARIRALEQRLTDDEAARAASARGGGPASGAGPAPGSNALAGSFGAGGYALQSADGANTIRFRGNVSVDGRYFSDSQTPAAADTWLIRRLRPTLEGTLLNGFDFRFMPDFAQGKSIIQDAWGAVRIEPWLALQFGKFKAPVGLERLQLEQFARFIEVSLPSDLLPYRDLGLKAGGALGGAILTYDVGLFDGTLDGASTEGNPVPDQSATGHLAWEGRVFGRPFLHADASWLKGLGIGLAGTHADVSGVASAPTATAAAATTSLLAGYKTPGQQPLFSYRGNTAAGGFNNATIAQGAERRLVPQFYYYYRCWNLLGEYVNEDVQVARRVSAASMRTATLTHTAWQIQGAWFLTGEDEAYDRATPRRNFDFGGGGPGAWELVARYHEIRFDREAFSGGALSFANPQTAPLAAYAIGAGVNWYLNPNFKVQLDYEVTRFEGGAVGGDRPDERVLTSQFALIF